MDVYKIALTGGPCSGKSTFIKQLKKYYEDLNYKVFVAAEAATDNILGGIDFKLANDEIIFQSFILKHQLFDINNINRAIALNKDQNCIVLYDRGILDNKAYLSKPEYVDYLFENENIDEINSLDEYDLVLDLVSLAVCDPDRYNLGNKARNETIEEARSIDLKTTNAWVGHNNMHIVRSNMSIEEELNIIINIINNLINKREIKKVERKIINKTLDDYKGYNDSNSRLLDIEEYILNVKTPKIKVYKRTYKNKNSYVLEMIKKEKDKNIIISSKKIDLNTFLKLINIYKIKTIYKYKQLSIIENYNQYNIKFYDDVTLLEQVNNTYNKNNIKKIEKVKRLLKYKKYANI